ncbi:hypothetical protein F0562_020794 [Nyssa sinensis]|uniref:MATH domain-containing protein n=1 Tax=Nyssa sinensis TaxID=561372 RepID=A0A5J5BRZ4_9ASTE|nr:hypothetical protein F0562_020794 [Nyssa sinensis]
MFELLVNKGNELSTSSTSSGLGCFLINIRMIHFFQLLFKYLQFTSQTPKKRQWKAFLLFSIELRHYEYRRLHFYPNGNKKRNVTDYISLYLVISDTKSLPPVWEIRVQFKLFVFDHIRLKYLTVQDAGGMIRRFNRVKIDWGFDQFLSLNTFKTASNGYLLKDSCVFGAEVFVIKYAGKGECLSFIKEPQDNIYTWKVHNFSLISDGCLSERFMIGEQIWRLMLFPKGVLSEGESLSLHLFTAERPRNWKLYADFKLRIKDQLRSQDVERQTSLWSTTSSFFCDYWAFMLLSDLNDKSRGFIVNNTLIIEVEILVMSVIKNFT